MPTQEECLEIALDMELRAALFEESKTAYLRVAAHWRRLASTGGREDAIDHSAAPADPATF
jgi:hypothetical protein